MFHIHSLHFGHVFEFGLVTWAGGVKCLKVMKSQDPLAGLSRIISLFETIFAKFKTFFKNTVTG